MVVQFGAISSIHIGEIRLVLEHPSLLVVKWCLQAALNPPSEEGGYGQEQIVSNATKTRGNENAGG